MCRLEDGMEETGHLSESQTKPKVDVGFGEYGADN